MTLSVLKRAAPALLAALFVLAVPGGVRASDQVLPGFDLYETLDGTTFGGIPFTGVPLGTFDFGGGAVDVGNTSTIVHRLGAATAPSTTISTELVALHLMSAVPADFGCGVGTYFITLQSERGGPTSPGLMTLNFGPEALPGTPHGTFDSFFDVFFDVRLGALNGPICLSDMLTVTVAGAPWNHFPVPGELLIPGVNERLNGTDRTNDFQPLGNISEQFPTGAVFVVRVTQEGGGVVPEPSGLAIFGLGALVALSRFRRRTRRSA